MHDINKTGWNCIFPFYVFKNGYVGANDFGQDPIERPIQFYDQFLNKIDQEIKEKNKRKRKLSHVILSLFLAILPIFMYSNANDHYTSEPISTEVMIDNDSIPGNYIIRKYYGQNKWKLGYATILRDENNFLVNIYDDFGKSTIYFLRHDSVNIFSPQLGLGKVNSSYDLNSNIVLITFSLKDSTKWEFKKSN